MKNLPFYNKGISLIIIFSLLLTSCNDISRGVQSHQETATTAVTISLPATVTTDSSVTSVVTTENVEISSSEVTLPVTTPENVDTTEAVVEATGNATAGYSKVGDNGILVIERNSHYMGLMPSWGTTQNCITYAESVNKFKAALPNVNVCSMVTPTSVEFYLPSTVKGFTASQKTRIDAVKDALVNVTDINVYDTLALHKDENIFARTDHHWLPLGAYYAAKCFADAVSVNFDSLEKYQKVERDGYVGSMYRYSKDENFKSDPEIFTMYMPKMETTTTYYDESFENGYADNLFVAKDASSFYCSFLGSDDRIAKIETLADNDRALVIFKESYGNALVPFLVNSFKTIYVCDIRYFNLNGVAFCKDVKATDLLFATCAFTPAGTTGNYLKTLLENPITSE